MIKKHLCVVSIKRGKMEIFLKALLFFLGLGAVSVVIVSINYAANKLARDIEESEKEVEKAEERLEELKRDIKVEKNTTYKLKEKPMSKIEELEQIIKDAQSKIEDIKEQDNNEDWRIAHEYSFDDDLDLSKGSQYSIFFSDLKSFNVFEEEEHAELWSRKINANLKLWHIAQKLNEGWKPDWVSTSKFKYVIDCDFKVEGYQNSKRYSVYFKSEELAEKAKRLMGDMLEDLYLEIY